MYNKLTTHKQHEKTGTTSRFDGCEATCGVAQENTDSDKRRRKRDTNVRHIYLLVIANSYCIK